MNPNPKVANGFKYLLLFTMLLLLAFIIIGFYYEQNSLREFAQSIAGSNQTTPNASSQSDLNLSKPEIDKIDSLFFEKANYQNSVKSDLNIYARKTRIKISDYIFSNTTSNKAGLQTVTVELNIKESVEYNNLIQFMKYIENSLPKIQIVNLNLERDTNGKVAVKEFKVEVYLQ
ncbi:MAG: hypothetical protein WBI29_03320 [Candidatus Saccharimonadales bacterium]